jgi:hypothetical protein
MKLSVKLCIGAIAVALTTLALGSTAEARTIEMNGVDGTPQTHEADEVSEAFLSSCGQIATGMADIEANEAACACWLTDTENRSSAPNRMEVLMAMLTDLQAGEDAAQVHYESLAQCVLNNQ